MNGVQKAIKIKKDILDLKKIGESSNLINVIDITNILKVGSNIQKYRNDELLVVGAGKYACALTYLRLLKTEDFKASFGDACFDTGVYSSLFFQNLLSVVPNIADELKKDGLSFDSIVNSYKKTKPLKESNLIALKRIFSN